jgi:hypothetical protein
LSGGEAFYALIDDEVIEEGTSLNAEIMNWLGSFDDLRDPTTGQKNVLQGVINNLFNIMTQPFTTIEYDELNTSAIIYDNKNITALNFDIRGRSLFI